MRLRTRARKSSSIVRKTQRLTMSGIASGSCFRSVKRALFSVLIVASVSLAGPAMSDSPLETLKDLLPILRMEHFPDGIAKSNGRIEGQEIAIATIYPGRLAEVTVAEGDIVEAGQVIARIDDREYRAQLLGAEAEVLRAEASLDLAEAQLDQATSNLDVVTSSHARVEKLSADGHVSVQALDASQDQLLSARAAQRAVEAQIANARAAIAGASASVSRLNAVLDEMILVAPRRGRVQYKLAQSGEVVGAGARIVILIDLTDISMSLYLTAVDVATLSVGDEARIILDAVSDYIIPARITFISANAQFTPKMVETAEERAKLVFRVKIQIPRDLLERFEAQVKVGIRGVGFVRTDTGIPWPADLEVRLPE